MGKYERDWAEEAEKNAAAGIRGEKVPKADQITADAILTYCEKQFNLPVLDSDWKGRKDYNLGGDITVSLGNRERILNVKVEIKTSREKGSGTHKNLSTNMLKKYFKNSVNYTDFEMELKEKRYDLVENVTGVRPATATRYNNLLRELIKTEPEVIEEIARITKPGQRDYAKYVTKLLNSDLNKTQEMVNDLLKNDDNKPINKDSVYCVVKGYESNKQTVEFFDFTEMDSNVASVVISGQSIKIQNCYNKDILRFSVHWKNICQGGATPCFNVFLGNAHK